MKEKFQPGDLVDIVTDNAYVGVGLIVCFREEADVWNKPTLSAYKVWYNGKISLYFAGELRIIE